MKINRTLLLAGGALLLLLAFFQIQTGLDKASTTSGLASKPAGAPFTLQSRDGEVSLSDFEGQLALVYFGYTWCPDICPASMMFMARALQNLPEELRANIQPIFISVDPQRDTPERLAAYVDFFEAGILGLTGDESTLQELARAYGAFYRYTEVDSAMGYTVDHTSDFYLVTHEGRLLATLPHTISGNQLTATLSQALQNNL
ncbi:SCO family protein [Marinospirillum alkaliphilum]|uniref:Protein SCO1/2 n=1 Tax=Marinospirillum alkaliphilum DSM 21637 TaxID=1122209 RepID=A0A1K1UEQ6_9GAMM|nr:SCO family protein [Marinospirillum alkaliphilum]SFX11274.1 protein SCO1/2 [Marinospirillum alkaliphilum DSM 21637]